MKTIKINLYSPKELWVMFWNRFFWPRRKQCAVWLIYGQSEVEYAVIHDVLYKAKELGINIDDVELDKLELAIKPKISEAFNKLRIVITKPIE